MTEHILQLLKTVPAEVKILIVAMLPIAELRGAIPLALLKFGLPLWQVYLLAVIGNMLPVIPLLLFLEKISAGLRRFKLFDLFFRWLFERTRKRSELVEKYETLGLMLFVAIPLPVTGAWTGTVAAFLFGIRFWYAFLAILAGVLVAGVIVTTLTKLGWIGGTIAAVVLLSLTGSSFWQMLKKRKKN
jgi:uncharacterized membrane protein